MDTSLTEKNKETLYRIINNIKKECSKFRYNFNDKDENLHEKALDSPICKIVTIDIDVQPKDGNNDDN